MESELATTAIIGGYWQAVTVIIAVVVVAVGAFSLVSFWAGRHVDAKFDKHAVATQAQHDNHAAAMKAQHDNHAAAMKAQHDNHAAAMEAQLGKHAAATAAEIEGLRKDVGGAFDKHAAVIEALHKEVDAKFDQHAAAIVALDAKFDKHAEEVKEAIARGTKEHEDWRVEMKAINEKVTDLVIDREVERRMQASRGGAPAGSDGADA